MTARDVNTVEPWASHHNTHVSTRTHAHTHMHTPTCCYVLIMQPGQQQGAVMPGRIVAEVGCAQNRQGSTAHNTQCCAIKKLPSRTAPAPNMSAQPTSAGCGLLTMGTAGCHMQQPQAPLCMHAACMRHACLLCVTPAMRLVLHASSPSVGRSRSFTRN